MSLDLVVGPKSHPVIVDDILDHLGSTPLRGTVYVGFPLMTLPWGIEAIDVLVTCREHGLFWIVIDPDYAARTQVDCLSRHETRRQAILQMLARSKKLFIDRKLIVDVEILTIDPNRGPATSSSRVADAASLPDTTASLPSGLPRYPARPRVSAPSVLAPAVRIGNPIASLDGVTVDEAIMRIRRGHDIGAAALRLVNAAVQGIGAFRPIKSSNSLGALAGPRAETLQNIDKEVRNMDAFQKSRRSRCQRGHSAFAV